jgi:ferritin-like metal-binding protein YciE
MATDATQKIIQYLNEAHAAETGMVRSLQSQIAMTPGGTYRTGLEKHLRETRTHAERLEVRLGELGESAGVIQAGIGAAETVFAQAFALSKTPWDLLRGSGGEEKVLKNAKDAAAAEALEIATYTALEQLARSVGDEDTAKLAASIGREEQRMLDRIVAELPKLTDAVVAADIGGSGSYDIGRTGAAQATRRTARKTSRRAKTTATTARAAARTTAAEGTARAKRTARTARKVPGAARAEGEVKGALAGEKDLPIANYSKLTADDITARLPELSQIDLSKIDAFERKHESRATVLNRIKTLRANEPWPGYDELSVDEVRTALTGAGEARTKAAREYERAHKGRAGVLEATERELANA